MSKSMPRAFQKCVTYRGGDDLSQSYRPLKSSRIFEEEKIRISHWAKFYFYIRPTQSFISEPAPFIQNMKDKSCCLMNQLWIGCLFSGEWKEGLTRLTGEKSDKDLLFQVSASGKVSFDMRKPFYAFSNSKNLKSLKNVKGQIFIPILATNDSKCSIN